jgi:hypothetical protein
VAEVKVAKLDRLATEDPSLVIFHRPAGGNAGGLSVVEAAGAMMRGAVA